MITFESFLEDVKASGHRYDIDEITRAYQIAEQAHGGQRRHSGEPYVTHPLSVATLLVGLGLDSDCIAAALLHDTIEDTPVAYEDLRKNFNSTVADLVDGVTKLGKIPYTSKEEEQMENLRKMFLATAKDIRVVIIKLADRLHNARTFASLPEEKQRLKALETMEVYAPLAHRLGMQRWKIELEDISLKYLDPIGYDEVVQAMRTREHERDSFLTDIIARIQQRFEETYMKVYIKGRVKHIYSVYRKMYGQNKTIDEIYDLYAIRIIVDNMNECYNALGVIHDMFKPIPGRFKDYISTPKPNMYQSLHTTVIGKEGVPFEVQIRTWDMHQTAEYGIAAHWKYKAGIGKKDSLDGKLKWVNELLEIQSNAADAEEFLRPFKIDFFSDEVFVFTPKGDLINLPAGATVIDFAYAIHSAVGNRMIGAKVNGKMVQLDYQVQNGEIVEVVTGSAAKGPTRDWLKIARTSEAKNKIKQWFKKERKEENIATGKAELEAELRRAGMALTVEERDELVSVVAPKVGITGTDELYACIGYGGIAISRVLPRMREEYNKLHKPAPADPNIDTVLQEQRPRQKKTAQKGVVVEGVENCLIKYARCCNPLPGDDIIGYITKGYGISVHRTDCPNVVNSLKRGDENERWLRVSWSGNPGVTFSASLNILADKRVGLLADITTALANMRAFIHAINAREVQDGKLMVNIVLDANDVEHINSVIAKLRTIPNVIDIKRGAGS